MKVTVLLADSAQGDNAGKVHALGIGWQTIGTPTPSIALVILVEAETAGELADAVQLAVKLVDYADKHVIVGDPPLRIAFNLNLQIAPSARRTAAAINISAGMPLAPGDYAFVVEVPDKGIAVRTPFLVQEQQDLGAIVLDDQSVGMR